MSKAAEMFEDKVVPAALALFAGAFGAGLVWMLVEYTRLTLN